MASKMSKVNRMGVAESALSDEGLEDAKEAVQTVMDAIEQFEESRTAAIDGFTEAVGYHEEREWEERDSSLEEAASAVEEMASALDEIEMQSEWVSLPDGRMDTLRKMITEVQEHLGQLI